MLLVVSCVNKTRETNKAARTSEEADNAVIVRESVMGVINADCDYYADNVPIEPADRLLKGQEVEIGSYRSYAYQGPAVLVDFRTIDGTIFGFIYSRYVTCLESANSDLWFMDMPLVREYYYTGTAEEIANNDAFRNEEFDDIEKANILQRQAAFFMAGMNKMVICDDFFSIGNDVFNFGYKILSFERRNNTYILQLSDLWLDSEITILNDGNAITIIEFIIKRGGYTPTDRYAIESSLNYRYVPYDDAKSGKAKAAFSEWCDEQLELLASRSSLVREFLNKVNERREMESRLRAEGAMLDGHP